MLGVWNRMDRWAVESGATLMYGLVKGDNDTMIGFQRKKKNYRFAGKQIVLSRPVHKTKRLHRIPEELGAEEVNTIIAPKKGFFYFLGPAVGLLLCLLVIAILLVDLSSHRNGFLFLGIFFVWVVAGTFYSAIHWRTKRAGGST